MTRLANLEAYSTFQRGLDIIRRQFPTLNFIPDESTNLIDATSGMHNVLYRGINEAKRVYEMIVAYSLCEGKPLIHIRVYENDHRDIVRRILEEDLRIKPSIGDQRPAFDKIDIDAPLNVS
ncbi:MAG: hypothetical protein AABW79_03080 [Nanoarchaeota archaeon]